jgi:Family of unknown function (DUF6504)
MSRRYGEPIAVTLRGEQPIGFTWRGRQYQVQVIGFWRLATRWWDAEHAADRDYYRLMAPDFGVYEVYQERTSGAWVLDRYLD